MIRRFLRLTPSDRVLVLNAAGLVCFVRASLWLLPYRLVRRILKTPLETRRTPYDSSRIAWAVSAVSPAIPGASCLTQALAAEFLLRCHGYQPSLHIGVAKNSSRTLEAHAWIELQGIAILGHSAVDRFTPLRTRGGAS